MKIDFNKIHELKGKVIFLAGTIDQGDPNLPDWQEEVFKHFRENQPKADLTILNPRRVSWDSSWEQTIENKEFNEQVTWELNGLEKADFIVMNLLPDSKSPISLLELGLHVKSNKMLVCCPKGFYRKGNVDITCKKYGIPVYENIEDLLSELTKKLEKNGK